MSPDTGDHLFLYSSSHCMICFSNAFTTVAFTALTLLIGWRKSILPVIQKPLRCVQLRWDSAEVSGTVGSQHRFHFGPGYYLIFIIIIKILYKVQLENNMWKQLNEYNSAMWLFVAARQWKKTGWSSCWRSMNQSQLTAVDSSDRACRSSDQNLRHVRYTAWRHVDVIVKSWVTSTTMDQCDLS